ncbi:MAG: hypothetical protein AAF693_02330 [Bacteroidota bacterium]
MKKVSIFFCITIMVISCNDSSVLEEVSESNELIVSRLYEMKNSVENLNEFEISLTSEELDVLVLHEKGNVDYALSEKAGISRDFFSPLNSSTNTTESSAGRSKDFVPLGVQGLCFAYVSACGELHQRFLYGPIDEVIQNTVRRRVFCSSAIVHAEVTRQYVPGGPYFHIGGTNERHNRPNCGGEDWECIAQSTWIPTEIFPSDYYSNGDAVGIAQYETYDRCDD